MIYSTLLLSAALASTASAACTREQLVAATEAYLKAQAAGDLSALPALAENVTYLENDAPMDITTGVLSSAITIDFSRSLHDSVECATFTEISAATNSAPYVIATRMLFTDDKITTVQSVVANDGDWAFNATGQLYWTKTETWDVIPEDQRDARDVIKAAGDAYLDSWGDGTVKVPYGTPVSSCFRHSEMSYELFLKLASLTSDFCSARASRADLTPEAGNRQLTRARCRSSHRRSRSRTGGM